MKEKLRNLIALGLVLVLLVGIVFADPDDDGGKGMEDIESVVNDMPLEDDISTEDVEPNENDILVDIEIEDDF